MPLFLCCPDDHLFCLSRPFQESLFMCRRKKHSLLFNRIANHKPLLTGLFVFVCAVGLMWPRAQAGNREQAPVWVAVSDAEARLANRAETAKPTAYKTFRLHRAALSSLLAQAPPEFTQEAKQRSVELPVPLPDGSWGRFRVVASSVMETELAARFPEIKTYAGQGLDEPTATARFSWTPQGFHATILSERGTFYVEPVASGDTENYLAYAAADAPAEVSFSCATRGGAAARNHSPAPSSAVISGGLKRYRLAVAATGEYTQTYGGGTVSGGLAAVTTMVNSVNTLYERELGARLVLVSNQASLIFTDPATDGYSSNNIGALVNENRSRLDAVLGSGGYDVGHVVDGHSIGGGFAFEGVAYVGVVCNSTFKGGGATILDSVQPAASIAAYILAHEIGHQFGATHTMYTTAGGCGPARTPSSAFEPASGRTIMGYRYTCGEEDTRSSFLHFHAGSIEQIVGYTNGGGAGCATSISNNNQAPVVNAGPDYHIPANTPFTLTATGQDPDGDALTYVWDDMDLGNASPPLADDGSRPLFRSSAPSSNPARIFPQLATILSGAATLDEILPTTTRTLSFRVTARDNRADGGALRSDDMQLFVHAGGAFAVTQPANGVAWTGGATQAINWNTAGTAAAPFGVNQVRLWLSTDGGNTFPYLLADATPNDGAENIIIPNVSTSAARVKVEAVGNVFFNLSPAFTINAGSGAATVQLSLNNGTATPENNDGGLLLTITRAGNANAPASVEYTTTDGTAEQRADYVVTVGTVNFAAGETAKTIVAPVVNDAYDEADETFRLTLNNAGGATLAGSTAVTLTIADEDANNSAPNPAETASFFARQQYYDFLNRTPDAAGLDYWTGQLTQCGGDPVCLRGRRIGVSAAFFIEQEFQESGAFVYRLYKSAFGEQLNYRPPYAQFTPDRARVVGGNDLPASKLAFANNFAQRGEFLARYPHTLTAEQFVDATLANLQTGANLNFTATERNAFIADVNNGGRGLMLRNLADNVAYKTAVFNRAFVLMQYFGYLRRDPDQGGYDFWLNVLNQQPDNARGMVCAFITSAEYQQRFAAATPRNNGECAPGV
jgi:hypothetical protein